MGRHWGFINRLREYRYSKSSSIMNGVPEVWLTAIRKDQTPFRNDLDIVTQDETGLIKVAPVFYWTDVDMEGYLLENELPDEEDYFDPTKVLGSVVYIRSLRQPNIWFRVIAPRALDDRL